MVAAYTERDIPARQYISSGEAVLDRGLLLTRRRAGSDGFVIGQVGDVISTSENATPIRSGIRYEQRGIFTTYGSR